ncbi:MAG: formyl transferase [Phycisphaerae bacterium]
MRTAILTSTDTRHRFAVNFLRARHELAAVVYQDTGYAPADVAADRIDAHTAAVLKHHFDERRRQEERFFAHDAELLTDSPSCRVLHVDTNTLNTDGTVSFLGKAGVEAVAVYGTGLIKPPLLDAFPGRMINMHLGLSPYYRGTATNFYPLLNDEPEYVGATIHLIDAGIDSGAIIHHARPDITADDMPHTVGCKAILAGLKKLSQTVTELAEGRLVATPQWEAPNPKLYLRKDYHPSQVVKLYEMIEAGLFPNYAARKEQVQNTLRLVH